MDTQSNIKGRIVEHEKYGKGKVFVDRILYQGKVLVYFDSGKQILCNVNNIKWVGFFD